LGFVHDPAAHDGHEDPPLQQDARALFREHERVDVHDGEIRPAARRDHAGLVAAEAGRGFALALGIGALYTFFANGVTWALGCNRAMAEAAAEGEFPAVLARQHRALGTPTGAAMALGVASTVVLLLYGFLAGSNEDLFWSLFAFSAVIFLMPYIVLVFAFVRMRRLDPGRHRPFRVPGGDAAATLMAAVCTLVLALSILLLVYTPGDGVQWPVLLGAVTVTAIGEAVIRLTERRRLLPAHASTTP
jgi:amino acid transporter